MEDANINKQEEIDSVVTEEDRDAYLNSISLIQKQEHSFHENQVYHTIEMNDEFTQMKLSEQYLYLVDLYEDYNEQYGELLPTFSFLNRMEVYLDGLPNPTYRVYQRSFQAVAANISIDRETGQRPSDGLIIWLDKLDKTQALDGTIGGLTSAEVDSGLKPIVEETLITINEEIIGALRQSGAVTQTQVPASIISNSNSDTEFYIDGMTGYDWVNLTENQKFHTVTNALYSLDHNGYIIIENEDFYISSLDAFYNDSSARGTPVNEALASIGLISNTISK